MGLDAATLSVALMHAVRESRRNFPITQRNLELAKWMAVTTMAIDHYGKIVDGDVFALTHSIGRLSFPLFAGIIAWRLTLSPALSGRYLRWLVPWALVSQPAYVLAGRDWLDGNILFTLALGIALYVAVAWIRDGARARGSMLAVATLITSWFVEFGPLGVLLIPAVATIASVNVPASIWLLAPGGLLVNMSAKWPLLSWGAVPVVLAPLVVAASVRSGVSLPRLPAFVFYVFYPAHLLALHYYDLYF